MSFPANRKSKAELVPALWLIIKFALCMLMCNHHFPSSSSSQESKGKSHTHTHMYVRIYKRMYENTTCKLMLV